MEYQFKLANLVLVTGTSQLDRALEGISHSPYSHVAGIVKSNEVFEADTFRLDCYKVQPGGR